MSAARIHLVIPDELAEFVRGQHLGSALRGLTRLAGAELTLSDQGDGTVTPDTDATVVPIRYRGQPLGGIHYPAGEDSLPLRNVAEAFQPLFEHLLEREMAVVDLARVLVGNYEELNVLYRLLPAMATKVVPADIGRLLVEEAAQTLDCRRVSVLVLDEQRQNLELLAACGLPSSVRNVTIPLSGTIAGRMLAAEDLLLVNDIADHPALAALARGTYESHAFATIRLPLRASGEPIGVLNVTERSDGAGFTARDRMLLEGLSAMGASALLNCRLHASVSRQMMNTIRALASAVDARDHYTHSHSARVAQLAVHTAKELDSEAVITSREVELAGMLHDVGKIGIPDSILSKPDRLAPAEYAVVKSHAEIGARIVSHVEGLERVAQAILHHHERYDGLGYPSGLAGEDIPLAARILAVADVYDTLMSDRPYRHAVPFEDAMKEIARCKGTQFDPVVVDALTAVIRREAKTRQSATANGTGGQAAAKQPARTASTDHLAAHLGR